MLLTLVVLFVLYMLWILVRPRWLPQAPNNRVNTVLTQNAHNLQATSARVWKSSIAWLPGRNKELAHQFKSWVTDSGFAKKAAGYGALAEEATAFSKWVDGLAESELSAFAQQVASFCKSVGGDLPTLVDSNAEGAPEMKQAIENSVVLYSLTLWKTREIQAMLAYTAWQKSPEKKENRAFAQRVFAKLVNAGVAVAPSELLMASDKERLAYVKTAIDKAAAEQRAKFINAVREAAEELSAESTEAAKAKEKPRNTEAQAVPAAAEAVA